MVVKQNQPELYHAIQLLFDQPPWLKQEQASEYQRERFTKRPWTTRSTYPGERVGHA